MRLWGRSGPTRGEKWSSELEGVAPAIIAIQPTAGRA